MALVAYDNSDDSAGSEIENDDNASRITIPNEASSSTGRVPSTGLFPQCLLRIRLIIDCR